MKRLIARWSLDRLKPHPRQASLFSDLDDQAFKDLVDDMKLHGLQKPVEVLPDGTIVCGHQRWRAAKTLGWNAITVWIRDDLAEQGDAAVEHYLITDNLHRRHLDKLDVARCYARLREIESSLPYEQRHAYYHGDLRDVLAKKIGGGSGRNLERYLHVLRTPMEVQEAFKKQQISLVAAAGVAHLTADKQAEIAAAIRSGEDPKQVIRKHCPQEVKKAGPKQGFAQQAAEIDRILAEIRKDCAGRQPSLQICAWLSNFKQEIDEILAGTIEQSCTGDVEQASSQSPLT